MADPVRGQARKKRFVPVKYRFAVYLYTMVFLIILMIAGLVTALVGNYISTAGRESTRIQIDQTNEILELFYAAQLKKTDLIQLNPETFRLLSQRYTTLSDALAGRKELGEWLERSAYDIKYSELPGSNYYGGDCIISVYVRNETLLPVDGQFERVRPYSAIVDTEWYRRLTQEGSNFAWESNVVISGVRYVAIYRKIIHPETLDEAGVLQICIPVAKIRDFLEKNKVVDAQLLLYSDDGNRPVWFQGRSGDIDEALAHLSGSDADGGFSLIRSNSQELILYTCTSRLNGWKLTCAVPTARFWQGVRELAGIFLAALALAAILCLLVAIRLAGAMTRRIGLLSGKTRRMGRGDFAIEDSVGGNDEITALDDSLIEMAGRIRTFDQTEMRLKLQIAEIRFELMQEQINPHLLYNTLSMIRLTAKKQSQPEIYDLSNNLILFYRKFLNEGQMICAIADELEMVRSYSEVAIRVYSLDVDLEINLPPELAQLWSIKLFLQPVVENAIIHGIRPYQAGKVTISGCREGDLLRFTVQDTGQGIQEDVMEELRQVINRSMDDQQGVNKHFGIYNVARRIRLIFGPEYGLALDSSPSGGTTVHIRLPALTQSEAEKQINR